MSNKTIKSASSNPRRSFIKKGAMGAALVTTISSKSAWAASCSCSGNLSNNQSGDIETCNVYLGYSPGSWGGNGNGDAVKLANFMATYYPIDLSTMSLDELVYNNNYLVNLAPGTLTLDYLEENVKVDGNPAYRDENRDTLLSTYIPGYSAKSDSEKLAALLALPVQTYIANQNDFGAELFQRFTAALNATVWAILVDAAEKSKVSGIETTICNQVDDWFYYPLSLSTIFDPDTSTGTLSGYHNHP